MDDTPEHQNIVIDIKYISDYNPSFYAGFSKSLFKEVCFQKRIKENFNFTPEVKY